MEGVELKLLSYRTFVKVLQCILVFVYAILVGSVMKEDAEPIIQFIMAFFPVLIILIELFRGDDL